MCKTFCGHMFVKHSFIEALKRAPVILVPNAGIYRDKKSDCVRQRRDSVRTMRFNCSAITITFMAASESARDSSYATHVESLFFREIVHLQCCALRAVKIFSR